MPAPLSAPLPDPVDARLRRRVRARLAALSLLGAAMVAIPLGVVLRYQDAELQTLAARRAGLEPMARAVEVQRSLLVHRDVAATVLRGALALEGERRVRQGEVDDRLTALAVTLVGGPWDRAVRESDALREDWSMLARRLLAPRGMSVDDSNRAHRLLVEQTLQVVDLLDLAAAPRSGSDTSLASAWDTLRLLPRQAARAADAQPANAQPAEAWQAQLAGFDASLLATQMALDAALAHNAQSQRLLLAAMAALAAASLLCARPLWRHAGRRAPTSTSDDPAQTGPEANANRQQAQRLFARLRGSEDPRPSRYGDVHLP